MPMYDFRCRICGKIFEEITRIAEDTIPCPKCGASANRQTSAVSFKIVGHRAANGYGLNFIDTPGRIEGELAHGYSFTPGKGGPAIDHTRPPKE